MADTPATPQTLRSQQLNGTVAPSDPRVRAALSELKTPDWTKSADEKGEIKNPFATTTEGAPAPKPAADDALAKRAMKLANDEQGLKLSPEKIKELLLEAKADKAAGPAGFSPGEALALKALDKMGLKMSLSYDMLKKSHIPDPAPPALKLTPPAPKPAAPAPAKTS